MAPQVRQGAQQQRRGQWVAADWRPQLQGPKLDEPEALEEEKQVSPKPDEMRDKTQELNLLGGRFSGDPTPRSLKLMRLFSRLVDNRLIDSDCYRVWRAIPRTVPQPNATTR